MSYHKTSLNLLDENGLVYPGVESNLYDESYETIFSIDNQKYSGIFNFGLVTKFPFALGTELSISAEVYPQFSDYLDGVIIESEIVLQGRMIYLTMQDLAFYIN